MTANSTIHIPPNNEMLNNGGASGAGAGERAAAGRGQEEEEVGWIGYFKSILAS